MPQSNPPKVVKVEVVATRPSAADSAAIAHLAARDRNSLPEVAYLVKIQLETIPLAASHSWALYVNDFRIPKYWAYKDRIYFKVFDREFLEAHHGQALRFSPNGTDFIDTGVKLPLHPGAESQAGLVRGKTGAPCGIRTHGPRIRNPVLYPSDLRGRADDSELFRPIRHKLAP